MIKSRNIKKKFSVKLKKNTILKLFHKLDGRQLYVTVCWWINFVYLIRLYFVLYTQLLHYTIPKCTTLIELELVRLSSSRFESKNFNKIIFSFKTKRRL